MKPLTVISDGHGMAREKNPYELSNVRPMPGLNNFESYHEFEDKVQSLPIYKKGQPWMGEGEVKVEIKDQCKWSGTDIVPKEWSNCHPCLVDAFKQMRVPLRQIYIIPEAQEAEANTLEAYLRSEIQGHDHERWFDIMLEGAKIGAKWQANRSVEKEKVIGIINKRIEQLDMRQDTLWELQDLIDKINQL